MVLWEIYGEKEPFSEYDERYSGQPGVIFEKDICMGLRPTIPQNCPCGELMREVRGRREGEEEGKDRLLFLFTLFFIF